MFSKHIILLAARLTGRRALIAVEQKKMGAHSYQAIGGPDVILRLGGIEKPSRLESRSHQKKLSSCGSGFPATIERGSNLALWERHLVTDVAFSEGWLPRFLMSF
jgi:hypothetical protein